MVDTSGLRPNLPVEPQLEVGQKTLMADSCAGTSAEDTQLGFQGLQPHRIHVDLGSTHSWLDRAGRRMAGSPLTRRLGYHHRRDPDLFAPRTAVADLGFCRAIHGSVPRPRVQLKERSSDDGETHPRELNAPPTRVSAMQLAVQKIQHIIRINSRQHLGVSWPAPIAAVPIRDRRAPHQL